MRIWEQLKNFNPRENWGKPEKINGALLWLLDCVATDVKKYARDKYDEITPVIIHCAYDTDGHTDNSQHYKGNAADFHVQNLSAKEVYEIMTLQTLPNLQMTDKVGLGVYPQWLNPGFHIDVRGEKARWSCVNGVYKDIKMGLRLLK